METNQAEVRFVLTAKVVISKVVIVQLWCWELDAIKNIEINKIFNKILRSIKYAMENNLCGHNSRMRTFVT